MSENVLVRETPRSGLLESLAVNEAMAQISEGKPYNSDACIANAIMYMTITEAMGELGFMTVDEDLYSSIITNAGGCVNEAKGTKIIKNTAKKQTGAVGKPCVAPANLSGALQESMCTQWAPMMNRSKPDDLAERIRQKRLLQEQQKLGQKTMLND